jgi:hypothetical protein
MKLTMMLLFVLLNAFAYGQKIDQNILSGKWQITNPYENSDTSVFKEYWEFKGDTLTITSETKLSSKKAADNVDKSSKRTAYLRISTEKIPYSIVGQSIKFFAKGCNTTFDIKELTEEKINGQFIINNFTASLIFKRIPFETKSK